MRTALDQKGFGVLDFRLFVVWCRLWLFGLGKFGRGSFSEGVGDWRGGLCFLLSEWRVSTIIVVDHVMWAKVRKRETFGVILCMREGVCDPGDVGSVKRREIGARRSSLNGRKRKEASVYLGLW